ncbi:MAG: DUF2085 domain-containing protein [Chloroflexi bacterium]|nr:DUF2085 domain-containing protein [Chloroflexota bacterium]
MRQRIASSGRLEFSSWKIPLLLVVLLLTIIWVWETPPGLLGKADAIGYAICHRIDLRSFHIGDRQLPLCARCMGMFLGALSGLVFQNIISNKHSGTAPLKVLIIIGIFVAAFAGDGINSYLSLFPGAPTLYAPNNTLRLLTGSGMGIALSVILFPAFNQSVWKDYKPEPAMPGLRCVVNLLLIILLIDALVLSENPLVLFPLAIISVLSVLIILTMVYTMLCLIVLRAENKYDRISEMIFPLTAGFGIALLQIGALDFIRYLFIGSWEGFFLG